MSRFRKSASLAETSSLSASSLNVGLARSPHTPYDRCGDYSRRELLKATLAGALGVSFSGWFGGLAKAASESAKKPKACILLWMAGGPSQMDTFDLKPGHKNGGSFKEIQTAVPGIKISEHLPGVAKQMKDLAIIRSMTTTEGDHGRGTQLMLTGYRPGTGGVSYPVLGASLSKELGNEENDIPNYVSLSPFRFVELDGPGFLGPQYAPLVVSGNSNDPQARANLSVEDLRPYGVDEATLEKRFKIRDFLAKQFQSKFGSASAKVHHANYEKAIRMIQNQARNAFKLDEESSEIRDKYGRNRFGQGCLLARRLVERGVAFVEVTLQDVPNAGAGWDTHGQNFDQVKALSETLDPAWSTLMNDLRERGLLESTMVIWMGEFGRTPVINMGNGRDHFPDAWSVVLGGAGIKGGQVIGKTAEDGAEVADRPVKVPELYATICEGLGISYKHENMTAEGRPIGIVDNSQPGVAHEPIRELVG